MGKLTDLVDSVGFGDDGMTLAYPDNFIDDIRGAYDEDFSISAAKITALEAELAEANAQIAALKAHNYDLITQIPAVDSTDESGAEDDGDTDTDDDDDQGVDSLFDEKEN